MAKNICSCPHPPGGTVECSANQMALCIVKDGVARHLCIDPIETSEAIKLTNWALTLITGELHDAYKRISEADFAMLRSGTFRSEKISVNFVLPNYILENIDELQSALMLSSSKSRIASIGLACPPYC